MSRLPTVVLHPSGIRLESSASGAGNEGFTNILLVEDHADTAKAFMKLLAHVGHQAVIASTLDQARAAFARQHFDILLCDITLPDGDGCDFIAELRAAHPDIRSIAISAAAYPRDAERCLKAGFTLHLAKPITVEGLLSAVDSLTLDAGAGRAPAGVAQPKAG